MGKPRLKGMERSTKGQIPISLKRVRTWISQQILQRSTNVSVGQQSPTFWTPRTASIGHGSHQFWLFGKAQERNLPITVLLYQIWAPPPSPASSLIFPHTLAVLKHLRERKAVWTNSAASLSDGCLGGSFLETFSRGTGPAGEVRGGESTAGDWGTFLLGLLQIPQSADFAG